MLKSVRNCRHSARLGRPVPGAIARRPRSLSHCQERDRQCVARPGAARPERRAPLVAIGEGGAGLEVWACPGRDRLGNRLFALIQLFLARVRKREGRGATLRFDEHQFPYVDAAYLADYTAHLARLSDLRDKHPDAAITWRNIIFDDAPSFSEISREMHRRRVR